MRRESNLQLYAQKQVHVLPTVSSGVGDHQCVFEYAVPVLIGLVGRLSSSNPLGYGLDALMWKVSESGGIQDQAGWNTINRIRM